MRELSSEFLNQILKTIIDRKKIFSAVLCVESGDSRISWMGAAGEMQKDSPYFIASVTKLYITAVIMRLMEEQKLSLDDRIAEYLPESFMSGLHVLKEEDFSHRIIIKHLISNTSGLPDYFFHRQEDGKTIAASLLEGNDESWYIEKTLDNVKKLKPRFKPGKKGKAAYSDTNYQLLGKIIEVITGKMIDEVLAEYVFYKLNLQHTYVYKDVNDKSPAPYYYKSKKLWLPLYMASVPSEGGIVSTAGDTMKFLKAFFNGQFFPKEDIVKLKHWNLILPPPGLFLFGIGLEKLWIPRIVSPFKPIKEILGFWGQTGSFAWYNPQTDLFFCGTTNQIDGTGHAAAARAIVKIIKAVL